MIDRSDVRFYVKVQVVGAATAERLDETLRVLSMSYEDTETATDLLKLSVDNHDLRNFDDPTFAVGNMLEVSWGYPGAMTQPRQCVITKVTGGQVLSVEAQDKGALMNLVMKSRSFESVTRSEIASVIAEEQGYGPDRQFIEDTKVVLPMTNQARMTDAAFLRQLAQKESFEFYVDARGFHFHPRNVGQAPRRVFTFFTDRTGTIMTFNLESDITAKPGAVTLKGINPVTKAPYYATANNDNTPGRPTLAPVVVLVDPRTGAKSQLTSSIASEAIIASSAKSFEDAKRQATGAFQRAQQAAVQMTWECIGDPAIEAKCVVEGAGFGRRLSGNYYVTAVTHKIKPGYTMTMKVRRDGTSAGTGGALGGGATVESSGAVNAAKGPADGAAAANELVPKKVVDPRTGETTIQYVKKGDA